MEKDATLNVVCVKDWIHESATERPTEWVGLRFGFPHFPFVFWLRDWEGPLQQCLIFYALIKNLLYTKLRRKCDFDAVRCYVISATILSQRVDLTNGRGGVVKRAQFFRFFSSEPFPYLDLLLIQYLTNSTNLQMVRRQCCLLLWVFLLAPTGALCVVNYFHFSKRNSCLSTLSQLQSFWPKLISSQSFVCSELLLEGSSALKETRQLIFFFQLEKPPGRGFSVFSHCQRSIFNIILKSWYFTLPNLQYYTSLETYIHSPRILIGHILWLLALNSQWLLFIRSTYNPGHLLRRHSPITYLHI